MPNEAYTDYKSRFKTDAPLNINDLPPTGFSFARPRILLGCLKNAFIIWLCPSALLADIELAAGH